MEAADLFQEQRSEMEEILRSGLFERSPRLAKFFRYICERHFDGCSDQIKEYSIAVEALGRPAGFDPKKDSIVRVEAHRLRKRLEHYYQQSGTEHVIQIVIPCGQYRPEFRYRNGQTHAAGSPQLEILPQSNDGPEPLPNTSPHFSSPRTYSVGWWSIPFLLLLGVLVACTYVWWTPPHSATISSVRLSEAPTTVSADSASAELRILAGYQGPLYMDCQGHAWSSDAFFHGGVAKPITADHLIGGQPDPHLLRSTRFGDFHYDIPLRQGTYELHLYFAETEYGPGNAFPGGDSTRTFQVDINGQTVLSAFDPLAEAGAPNRLLDRVFRDIRPAHDGKLHLAFESSGRPAMLSGIEILPNQPGRTHPVRIVTQPNPITDSDGRLWAADEYFFGGTFVSRQNVLLNPRERSLYQGERYGNFCYHIPLAPGTYRLTLYFAEQWFGTEASGLLSPDHRSFDVFANRTTLLKDFTPASEAGGTNRTIEKTFENISPNAQGMLLLEFVPIRNYAEINAIELTDTQCCESASDPKKLSLSFHRAS